MKNLKTIAGAVAEAVQGGAPEQFRVDPADFVSARAVSQRYLALVLFPRSSLMLVTWHQPRVERGLAPH